MLVLVGQMINEMRYLDSVYSGKTILVTGHTGFKGSWLSHWLCMLGANVVGLSVDIPTSPSNFEITRLGNCLSDYRGDIRDKNRVRSVVQECQPDFVFHLAAQSLVRLSYEQPLVTLETNALGTANVLDALRSLEKPVVAVMVTSDKCYDNVEWAWGYRENDRLGGKDPYSASKGMAELAIRSFVASYFNLPECNVRVGITRAGNVIGGGDWAKDRIVADCMKAWSCGEAVEIRNPEATRPWQHVLEPLSGYLALGAALIEKPPIHGEPYNFGPPGNQDHTVRELINEMKIYWDNVRWKDIAMDGDHMHEAGLLKLNCDKALFDLGWLPTLRFEETVRMTVEWHKVFYQDQEKSMHDFTRGQIDEYMALAADRGISWA